MFANGRTVIDGLSGIYNIKRAIELEIEGETEP